VFTMSPSGAATYTFSNGSATVSPLGNISYSVTGTDALGCVSAGPAVSSITVVALPVISVNSGTSCPGNPFTMTPSGAATYTFFNGSAVVNPIASASYSVIGTSSVGCVSSNVAVSNITVVAGPVLAITGNSAICNGTPVTLTVSGSSTYTWSTGSNSTTITVNPTVATTYTVSSYNSATGCFGSLSRQITIGVLPVISVNSGNLCAGSAFTMTPTGAATYTFSNGTSTVSAVVSPTSNTSYYVTGTSAEGCVSAGPAIANVIINQPPVITVNSGSICAGQVFTMSPAGASTYTFSNGSHTVSPASSTSYSVYGIDVLGCISSMPAIASVVVNPLPAITVSNGTMCIGSSYMITPSGAATYTYSGGSPVVAPAANTNYSVTGTSSAGCVSPNPAVLTVSVVQLPVISASDATICPGQTYTLSPSGAATYTYSSGSPVVTPVANTTYSITGTSVGGCVSASAAVVNVSIASIPYITVNSGTICSGYVFTITPSGAATYTYSSGSATVNPMVTTSYSVTGSNSFGCPASNTVISVVTTIASPTLYTWGGTTICRGETVTLNAGGAISYSWNAVAGTQTYTDAPIATTIYTVSGANSIGCISSATQAVVVNQLPVITAVNGSICPGGSFIIAPSGANTYTYSSGAALVSPSVTTVYSVTGTDANGCVSGTPATVTVSITNSITVSVSGSTLICEGSAANLSADGASTYSWSTGALSSTIAATPSANTTYTVYGTSGTCADTVEIEVMVKNTPTLAATALDSVVCAGQPAVINVSGASSYTWTTGDQTTSITVTPSVTTTYSVIGTGTNGCTSAASITQLVNQCTGIKELADPDNFPAMLYLYPNPNSGLFTVETSRNVQMIVTDSPGQTIMSQGLEEGKHVIDLSRYAKGIYFARFNAGKSYRTIKVIID